MYEILYDIRKRIINIIDQFNEKLIEREEVIPLLILALYSRQNILLFGEAGVSKTRMMLLLASLTGYKDYNINLAEITSPKEMIGTLEDLKIENFKSVLNCEIALFDEIYKALENGILHSLLNIIRERSITLQGKYMKLPLKMVIGASNEFAEGKALEPFDDRFGIRFMVKRIQKEDNFMKYWNEEFDKSLDFENVNITDQEIDSIRNLSTKVNEDTLLTQFVKELRYMVLREKLRFSDRAFGDAKEILKLSAILNGRLETNISEAFLFNHIGWREPIGKERINNIINLIVFGKKEEIQNNINLLEKEIQKCGDQIQGKIKESLQYSIDLVNKDTFAAIRHELEKILNEYATVLEVVINITKKRKTHKYFERLIKENIFIKNYKDTVFDVEMLIKLRNYKNNILNKINEINEWLEKNESLPIYTQNKSNIYNQSKNKKKDFR